MRMKDVVISMIIFTAALTAGLQFGTNIFANYDVPVDQNRLDTLQSLKNQTRAKQSGYITQAKSSTKNIGRDISENVFILSTAYQGIMATYNAVTFIPTIFETIVLILPVPNWLVAALSAIATVVVVYMILRRYGGA